MPGNNPLGWGVPEISVPHLGRALGLANAPIPGALPLPLQGSLLLFFHSFSLFLAGWGVGGGGVATT